MALHDEAAAARLRREVHRQYESHHGVRFTKTGLAVATRRSRPTLDNWLEKGTMPDAEGMASLASAVGVPASQLWVKWLDLSTSDPLVRIADALERAYPSDPAAEDEAQNRATSIARSHPAPPIAGASEAPPIPPSKAGSGRR